MANKLAQRLLARTASYTIHPFADAPGTRYTNRGATAGITITLPKPTASTKGSWYEFQVIAAFAITLSANTTSDFIAPGNAACSTIVLSGVGGFIHAVSDGSQWHIILDGGYMTIDAAGAVIAGGAALTLTRALHDGKVIALDTLAGTIITLPVATGSGMRVRCIITVIATSVSHKIQVTGAADTMTGMIMSVSDDAGFPVKGYTADATAGADTITLNRSTTGSTVKGEWIDLIDIAANVWAVAGMIAATGTEATPFSSAV